MVEMHYKLCYYVPPSIIFRPARPCDDVPWLLLHPDGRAGRGDVQVGGGARKNGGVGQELRRHGVGAGRHIAHHRKTHGRGSKGRQQ